MGEKTALEKILERFELGKTIELTPEEEFVIVDSLVEADYIDNGSSRVVYALGKEYVVKIAMSTGGVNQNTVERNFYACHGDKGYFAHLYAYGKMINIMEYLEDCSYYDPDDFYYDENDEADTEFYRNICDIIDVVSDITDYYGGDNGQIGYSQKQGLHVLYDYGYSMDYERKDIVDDVGYWMESICPIQNALNVIKGNPMLTQDEIWDVCRNARVAEGE